VLTSSNLRAAGLRRSQLLSYTRGSTCSSPMAG